MHTSGITSSPPPIALYQDDADSAVSEAQAQTSLLANVGVPGDAIGTMMFLIERSAQYSRAQSELRIQETREQLQAELKELIEELEEAARLAREAAKEKDDGGGFFGKLFSGISKIVGKIVGIFAEIAVDTLIAPIELSVSAAQDLAKGQNILQGLKQQALDTAKLDGISKDLEAFSEGAARFAYDSVEFFAKTQLAAVEAAASGKNLGELLVKDAKKLFDSFRHNILENPGFATVMAAVAIAASVMTCGVGACLFVAIALLVTLEVDRRTGFIEDTVGKDAAPFVRAGMQLAAAVCLGAGGGQPSDLAGYMQLGAAVSQGAVAINNAVNAIKEGERAAAAIDNEADQLETLQTIARLQHLMDRLLASLEEDSETHTKTREISADVAMAQAAVERALLLPA